MFGIDDAIAAVGSLADSAIKRIWPDATEVEKAKIAQLTAEVNAAWQSQMAQIDVNKIEAGSQSVFVSGWRPAVGWMCSAGFGYEFLLRPLVNGLMAAAGLPPAFPGVEVEALSSLLFGLLGLGALRTVEKINGVARASLK
jgi:hypothetical protein